MTPINLPKWLLPVVLALVIGGVILWGNERWFTRDEGKSLSAQVLNVKQEARRAQSETTQKINSLSVELRSLQVSQEYTNAYLSDIKEILKEMQRGQRGDG